jgi:hypothetical protein
MNHNLIKEELTLASTHYDGDLNDDLWSEIVWLKTTHHPERSHAFYTHQYVYIDLGRYNETGEIVISYSDIFSFITNKPPGRFKEIKK